MIAAQRAPTRAARPWWIAGLVGALIAAACAGAASRGGPTPTPLPAPADTAATAVVRGDDEVLATEALRLVLNVPAYRLDVLRGDARVNSYRVAVGLPAHPTPPGRYAIDRVTWNPWWHPPDREWARGAEVTPPCPENPMGRVKIYFRELYFIHGTPEVSSLGQAASHGCVRMANADALELARTLAREAAPGTAAGELAVLEENARLTRTVRLERAVPLEVRYDLVEVVDGELWMYPDVYGRCETPLVDQALMALERAGYPAADAWGSRLDELATRSTTAAVSLPVRAVLRGPPPATGDPSPPEPD